MAEPVKREWRRRKASHSTNLHLPREVADILAEMAQQIANQNIRLVRQAEEMAALRARVETITSALLEHLPRERVA